MPDTTASRSGEGDSVIDEENLIDSAAWKISNIIFYYEEDMIEGQEAASASRRHNLVAQWYKWCDLEYPGTGLHDWDNTATAAGEDVDIRLLTRGCPIAGYAILLFHEACYAVDRAFCSTDMEALAKVTAWHMPQEIRACKYLMSQDMILWWTSELADLENEVMDPFSRQVPLSNRIEELQKCLARLEAVMELGEGIGTNIWTTMGEQFSKTPDGLGNAIDDRVERLETSVVKLLQQRKQDDVASKTSLPTNYKLLESNVAVALDVAPSIPVDPPLRLTLPTPGLQHLPILPSLFALAMSHFETSRARCNSWRNGKRHNTLFCGRKCILPGLVGQIRQLAVWKYISIHKLLSILSTYLVAATTIRTGPVGLRYKSWFWLWLSASVLITVLGLSLFTASPLVSTILLWAGAFTQVVVPPLTVTKAGAAETRNTDDVERYGD
ncbi:hypothetical protein ACMFMG_001388 [Clarireedia jacksonii]